MTLQNVFWYNQGDIHNGGYPAVVMADHGAMGLKLYVPFFGPGPKGMKTGVRNVSDPLLQERPVLAKNNGAWESAEQYLARKQDDELQAEINREQAKKDREAEFAERAKRAKELEPVSA